MRKFVQAVPSGLVGDWDQYDSDDQLESIVGSGDTGYWIVLDTELARPSDDDTDGDHGSRKTDAQIEYHIGFEVEVVDFVAKLDL